jgi:glycosyltransferase involved in cell wall biosynthesis
MSSSNDLRFSIVIPAYNEEQYLPRLLDSIEVARWNYSGGPEAIEVIVADNDSSDRTAEVAAARGARVVTVKKRRIAAARNGGGRAAQAEIVCFIDGDSALHPQTFDAIDQAIKSGRYVAGSTGLTLERKSIGLMVTYCLAAPMVWISGMDAGVIFCRREDFEAVGGYDESRLYAEDLLFLIALRRLGKTRGQRLTRLPQVKALGCTRKFDQFGDWHYFGMLGHAIKSLVTGNWHDENLAERYWYKSGR